MVGKKYELIKKKSLLRVVSYCSENAAKRCILIYAVNFIVLPISTCTYPAMARAVEFLPKLP